MLLDKEKAKYQKVYKEIPSYNVNYSPGECMVDLILHVIRGLNVSSVLDAGCGRGQVVDRFEKDGFNVRGCDLTLDGLLPHINDTLCVEAPLSDMPYGDNEFDLVICIDVLEHIPRSLLIASIKELYRVGSKHFIIQVSTHKDCYGRQIGETLHETVMPRLAWDAELRQIFDSITELEFIGGNVTYYCVKHG